jgi:uncharacterized tellurite resistance protein B-like protein
MTTAIASFFQKHLIKGADEVDEHIKARRARLAAAVLLVEVVNADGEITPGERVALLAGIQSQFSLAGEEARQLLALAETQSRDAVDLHQFTSLINKQFTPAQKLELIEELWRAAYVDEILHRHEEHIVRKVADLLYVPTAAALAAKHRVNDERKSG